MSAAVQLPVQNDGVGDLADHVTQPIRRGLVHRPRRGLDGVGQHEDRRLSSLRLRSGVAKILLLDGAHRGVGVGLGPLVEEGHQLGSVMLRDDVHDLLRKSRLARHLDAVLDVGGDDQRGHRGREPIVGVTPPCSGAPILVVGEPLLLGASVLQEILGAEEELDLTAGPLPGGGGVGRVDCRGGAPVC